MRNKHPTLAYFSSSIWPGIRTFSQTVLHNATWQLSVGGSINFWTDKWLSDPIVNLISLSKHLYGSLSASVKDFSQDGNWVIPLVLAV